VRDKSISVQKFDQSRVSNLHRLFSDEIDSDPWIMFHGTSGYNADSIERDGFVFRPDIISQEQIQRVTSIYERMKWGGESGGGYFVLKGFSLDYDFLRGGLLFFAETSLRALLYATRDFSGGERLRALRIAFCDLDAYLGQGDVRQRHQELMHANFRHLHRLNAHASMIDQARPVDVNLDRLRKEIASLKDVRQLAELAYQRHDHCVVYALGMTPDTLEGLQWNSFMGIESATPISLTKIVAKVVIPPEYKWNSLFDTNEEYLRRQSLGLIPAICATAGSFVTSCARSDAAES
jgi:hypothetical protein